VRLSKFKLSAPPPPPLKAHETTRAYFERIAHSGWSNRGDYVRSVRYVSGRDGVLFGSQASVYNSQLRTTCVATILEGGQRSTLPQLASAKVQFPVLPGCHFDEVKYARQCSRTTDHGDRIDFSLLSAPSALMRR